VRIQAFRGVALVFEREHPSVPRRWPWCSSVRIQAYRGVALVFEPKGLVLTAQAESLGPGLVEFLSLKGTFNATVLVELHLQSVTRF
jgi:hypothetical protein